MLLYVAGTMHGVLMYSHYTCSFVNFSIYHVLILVCRSCTMLVRQVAQLFFIWCVVHSACKDITSYQLGLIDPEGPGRAEIM